MPDAADESVLTTPLRVRTKAIEHHTHDTILSPLLTPDWSSATKSTAPSSILSDRLSERRTSWVQDDDARNYMSSPASSCDGSFETSPCKAAASRTPQFDLENLLEQLDIKAVPPPSSTTKLYLLDVIGEGTHALVHRALLDGRTIAAKIASSQAAENCLRHENRMLEYIHTSNIDTTNIIGHFTSVNQGMEAKVMLELAESDMMTVLLNTPRPRRPGPITGEDSWLVMSVQLASALRNLHSIGLVHGDIKPHNVLVTAKNVLKLADFETSMVLDDSTADEYQRDGFTVAGTTTYSAPECLRFRQTQLTKEADVYALGVTLLVLACGEEPYASARTNIERIIQCQAGNPIRYMSSSASVKQCISPLVQTVVGGCCHRDPVQRWTATQVVAALSQPSPSR